ncbi:MAG: NifU family protein [Tenacibaculum sp.]
MKTISIDIQETNNKSILKFVSNILLTKGESYQYNNVEETSNSYFVNKLFHLPFIKKVFISANFIAIQRYDNVQWSEVAEQLKQQIQQFLQQGEPIVKQKKSKKIAVEVYAEATPNPQVMKFGTSISLTQFNARYKNVKQASKSSPLARALFQFPFVKEVFISENYISIAKNNSVEWNDIYQEIRTFIQEYIKESKIIISQKPKQERNKDKLHNRVFSETETKIIEILNQYVRPAVASDGGNIAFQSYNENTKQVSVVLEGACSGCPSSVFTLKNGIETLLKDMLPNKISEVVAINQ